MQPRQPSYKEKELTGGKRKLVGRARRPGIKRKRTSDATALAPTELESKNEVPSLDEVVSSLSSKILPVLEQKIETIISRGSEAKETDNNEDQENLVWVIGSSIIKWAFFRARRSLFRADLSIKRFNGRIFWQGKGESGGTFVKKHVLCMQFAEIADAKYGNGDPCAWNGYENCVHASYFGLIRRKCMVVPLLHIKPHRAVRFDSVFFPQMEC
uniref:Uncharacterized protein n=1 Tax=Magallana gigas TaxID=29159 RepID=A0A8W8JI28_MAGGI